MRTSLDHLWLCAARAPLAAEGVTVGRRSGVLFFQRLDACARLQTGRFPTNEANLAHLVLTGLSLRLVDEQANKNSQTPKGVQCHVFHPLSSHGSNKKTCRDHRLQVLVSLSLYQRWVFWGTRCVLPVRAKFADFKDLIVAIREARPLLPKMKTLL